MSALTLFIDQQSWDGLNSASVNFKNGNRFQGLNNFISALPQHRNKVYEQIWIDRERPQGDPEYGEHVFFDSSGESSSPLEKAVAIDRYLDSLIGKSGSQNVRLLVNGDDKSSYERTFRNGKWVTHPKGYPPPIDTNDVWCPTTQDECVQVGVAITVVGIVVSGGYAVYRIIQAFRGAFK